METEDAFIFAVEVCWGVKGAGVWSGIGVGGSRGLYILTTLPSALTINIPVDMQRGNPEAISSFGAGGAQDASPQVQMSEDARPRNDAACRRILRTQDGKIYTGDSRVPNFTKDTELQVSLAQIAPGTIQNVQL